MRTHRRWIGTALALVTALIIAAGAACGDDGESEAKGAESAGGGEAVTAIGAVATDNKYDKTAYTVPAGQEVTLTLENKGQALHDWKVQGVKGKDGKDIATQLLPGGQSQTITFTIDKAGTYDFLCSVHPAEMRGKLTVK